MQPFIQSKASLIALVAGAALLGCSSNDKSPAASADGGGQGSTDGGGTGGGGSGGASGDGSAGSPDGGGSGGSSTGADAAGCSVVLSTSADDQKTVQAALIEAKSGDTICLSPGTYHFTDNLSLQDHQDITFRGTGSSREDVLLDFTDQTAGSEGVLVTANGFTIENLWIKNTSGNGIKVQADDSVFRNIKVSWDTEGDSSNGAYAIYPTGCNHTLMEDNEVTGAEDAGIYAGQCRNVIARRNEAHGNVLGIEIENTTNAEVYDNDVYDNTTGFLLDLLPNLQKKDAHNYLVHDNHVHDNNRPNFAQMNTLAATAPQGTGFLVLAAADVEITGNTIENNGGAGVLIVSYDIIDLLSSMPAAPDPDTPRYPTRIYVHDNTFMNNGMDPQGTYALFAVGDGGNKAIPYNVLWDGILEGGAADGGAPDGGAADGGALDGGYDAASAQICLGTTEATSFVNFHADTSLTDPTGWTTDTTDHECTLPAIPPVEQP